LPISSAESAITSSPSFSQGFFPKFPKKEDHNEKTHYFDDLVLLRLGSNAFASRSNEFLLKAPAESTKYTQQLNIDVGDVPNHIVRVFELHYTFPTNAPVINGVKVVGGGLVALQTTTMGMVQTRSTSYT
jgi:hypothetical protein